MTDRPSYVVDASVDTRWYPPNPPYVDLALDVRGDYQRQDISLLAPDNLRYEVSGATRRGVITKDLRVDQAEERIAQFLDWQIPTLEATDLILPAQDFLEL